MIGIVNYGAGNIFSLTAALARLDIAYGMINEPQDFDRYQRIIIPGVGHAGTAMAKLVSSGLAESIYRLTKPVLGICVGMQLLSARSEEGSADMLGIVPVDTLHFRGRISEKVPHMGWNSVNFSSDCPLFKGTSLAAYFYFVHSYFVEDHERATVASTDCGVHLAAAINIAHFWAVQFHPQKSGEVREQLLRNFNNFLCIRS